MNFITKFSLRSPAVIVIAVILLFAGGIYSVKELPMETMPDLEIPVVTIVTVYPGAGPNEVLEEITKPIEQATHNIDSVKDQTSISSDNVSVVVMEFDFGDDIDKGKREIDDAIATVDLPESAQDPEVGRISFDAMPIMRLAFGGKKGDSEGILDYVENDVIPDLQGIEGVAQVRMLAEDDDNININLKPDKLKQYGLTSDQISQFLMASNIAVPAGELSLQGNVLPITVGEKYDSIKALKEMPLLVSPQAGAASGAGQAAGAQSAAGSQSAPGAEGQDAAAGAQSAGAGGNASSAAAGSAGAAGQAAMVPMTVKLGEVADITRGSAQTTVASRLNFKPAVGVSVIKDPDANTVQVADAVNDKIDSFRGSGPDGLKIRVIEDASIMVRNSISGLVREGLMGAVLAMIIILIFLGNWRSTVIAVVSIPLSILIGLIVIKQFGMTLNIMSLAGLAVATGRIVDDSIVVIENIFRHRQINDLAGNELVQHGTSEVSAAITSSTLTVVGAFIPLALVTGIIGQVFAPFAVAVVSSILASLLVAVTVVPLMAKFLIARAKPTDGRETMKLAYTYRAALEWSLNHKFIVLTIAFAFFASSLLLITQIGSNFLPTDKQEALNVSIEMPPGTSFNALNDQTKLVEDRLDDKSIESVLTTVGSPTGSMESIMGGGGSSNQANIFVELKEDTDVDRFSKRLRDRFKKIGGDAEIAVAETNPLGGAMNQQIEILVTGNDLGDIRQASKKIQKSMEKIDHLANVKGNLQEVKTGIFVDVDNEKAAAAGLTSAQIGLHLRELFIGKNVSRITIEDEGVDVDMNLQYDELEGLDDLKNIGIPTPLGISVPLSSVAEVKERPTPVAITRRNEKQYASITADITTNDSGKVSRELKQTLDAMALPKGVATQVSGVTEYMEEGFGQLGMAMVIAIGVVYLIMVMTFGEARAPLAILFSLPFAATGALIGLYVGNQQLNVSSMIGGLMLIGIVVTNAIVLIELVQQKRNAGVKTRQALLDGGTTRFRPILMTAFTTIFALLPLGLGLSEGGLISQSLAVAVIGGLTTSTFLTLIITPVIFEMLAGIGGSDKAV